MLLFQSFEHATFAGFTRMLLLQEGFEQMVFDGAWPLFESSTVHNVIVEVKEFNSPAKRAMLLKLMTVGGFKRAYNYNEVYGHWYVSSTFNVFYIWLICAEIA